MVASVGELCLSCRSRVLWQDNEEQEHSDCSEIPWEELKLAEFTCRVRETQQKMQKSHQKLEKVVGCFNVVFVQNGSL